MFEKPIFFSDIELGISNPRYENRVFQSFLAYYLFTNEVLVHPLYLYSSTFGTEIFSNELKNLITPEYVKFVLDKDESIANYIFNRIEILKKTKCKLNLDLSELNNYNRIDTDELLNSCNRLDKRFTINSGSYSIQFKDKRFRELIITDLINKSYQGTNLYALLWKIRFDNQIDERGLENRLNKLILLVEDKNFLISCDTLKFYLINLGFNIRSLDKVNQRLRNLMVYSHADGNVFVPSNISDNKNSEFFRTDFFWHSTNELIGNNIIHQLFSLDKCEQLVIVRELKSDENFRQYTSNYFNAIEYGRKHCSEINIEEIKKYLRMTYPKGFNSCITKDDKFSLISLIFSVGSFLISEFKFSAPTILSSLGIIYGSRVLKNLKNLAFKFNNSEYSKLKESIRKNIVKFEK